MNRTFDRIDLYSALGLFVGIAAWAFLWAHPYPHPDLWPFLVAVQGMVGSVALGVAGRLALGVFAAFIYLDLRGFWFLHRDEFDELPDNFCFTRTAPICAAAAFAMFPCAWRAGQFLSPGFALFVLILFGLFLWFLGRGGRGLLAYAFAYLLFGFASGANILGFGALAFAAVSDVILRLQDAQAYGEREDDDFARRKRSIETWFSVFAGVVGFIGGACLLAAFAAGTAASSGLIARGMSWWTTWTGAALRDLFAWPMLMLVLAIVLTAVGLAIGRRIRSLGPYGRMMCLVFSGLLTVATLAMFLLAVDRPERIRLQAIREYASLVADDVRGVKFLFTDGRFDDVLRLEFAARGLDTAILNTMAAPTSNEAARLKTLAPEPGDRAIFEAGGAEVFKAWARERPDRLAASAWQLGGGIVRRHGKLKQRTHGTVIRGVDEARGADDDAADRRFVEWTKHVAAIAEGCPVGGTVFGGTDDAVARKFDALLWRAARIASERAERHAASKAVIAAEQERQTMRKLDGLNASLRAQGEVIERMLPTEKLVFTAHEALDVALKRADFTLARRYASEILAGSPDDSAANFALGMANLEEKEYFRASVSFEKALRRNPNEPAALNNLAIAYLKLGQGEKALACVERAAKVHPKSAEIQRTLAEIRKNVVSKE